MKLLNHTLLFVALVSLLLAGLAFSNRRHRDARPQFQIAEETIQRFREKFLSPTVFDLNDFEQFEIDYTLVDPKKRLPETFSYPLDEVRALYSFAQTCTPTPRIQSPSLKKALAWEEYRCGRRSTLPNAFFETAPFIHVDGESFALKAKKLGRLPFDSSWIKRHEKYFHVLELYELGLLKLPVESKLYPAFFENKRAVLTGDEVFFKDKVHANAGSEKYLGYPLAPFKEALNEQNLQLFPLKNGYCPMTVQDLCLNEVMGSFTQKGRILFYAMNASLLFLLVLLGISFFRNLVHVRRERKAKEFIFRMLVHELRTPVAALKLFCEEIRRDFDSLPTQTQDRSLRILSEVERLTRVVQASEQYIQLEKSGMRFKPVNVESINQYFEGVLEPYLGKIDWTPLKEDRGFSLDPYWVSMCVRNLVQNAIQHGAFPVQVRISLEDATLTAVVQDSGTFSTTRQSSGLGMGLSIVEEVVKGMKGNLAVFANPTRFQIQVHAL